MNSAGETAFYDPSEEEARRNSTSDSRRERKGRGGQELHGMRPGPDSGQASLPHPHFRYRPSRRKCAYLPRPRTTSEELQGWARDEIRERRKAMSVSLLTGHNPVPIRGYEKEELIKQFFALTNWGPLDFLLVDLPPGTGDELLSAFKLFAGKSTLILVTTPSKSALRVVWRLSRLAKAEGTPLCGVVLSVAFMRTRGGRVFPFGRQSLPSVRRELRSGVLVEFPLCAQVNTQRLASILRGRNDVSSAFEVLTRAVVGPKDSEQEEPSNSFPAP